MNTELMFSSSATEWETPQDFFNKVNKLYDFELDVCATKENAKCKRFYSPADDALKLPWKGTCWMNPPFGKEIGKWLKKAYDESRKAGTIVVALLPARTDTRWFHDYIYEKPGVNIQYIKGRLKFGDSKTSAPFPSMLVEFMRG